MPKRILLCLAFTDEGDGDWMRNWEDAWFDCKVLYGSGIFISSERRAVKAVKLALLYFAQNNELVSPNILVSMMKLQ